MHPGSTTDGYGDLLHTNGGDRLILRAIYLINNEFPDLADGPLDHVVAVAETAALYLVVEEQETPEAARAAAAEFWERRAGGTEDPDGYAGALALGRLIRPRA